MEDVNIVLLKKKQQKNLIKQKKQERLKKKFEKEKKEIEEEYKAEPEVSARIERIQKELDNQEVQIKPKEQKPVNKIENVNDKPHFVKKANKRVFKLSSKGQPKMHNQIKSLVSQVQSKYGRNK